MDYSTFVHRVNEVEKEPKRFFILDPEIPLDVYYGINANGHPVLLIEDIEKKFSPSEIPSTEQILVESFKRKGKACLSFTLLASEYRGLFTTLCYDLLEAARHDSRQMALVGLLNRFIAWQSLLKGLRSGIMSLQQQRGLIGELLAIQYFAESMDIDLVLDAWVGPLKQDKDFEFYDTWAEVKSCQMNSTTISISSVEQLDSSNTGKLLVFHIDHSPENKEDTFSLVDLVTRIRSMIDNAAMRKMFDSKLLLLGFADYEPEYQKKEFCLKIRSIYSVGDSFPCLHRNNLPSQIVNCKYSISLPAIENYREE